ncbi:MAG: small subunit ribosomal protein [Thermoproteota archaeon]|nr:small subunit ribosomal protein [Thermoproteota archaeon]
MPEEFRHIVRISGTDLDGSQKLEYGLTKIKGINTNLSKALIKVSKLESVQRIGNLTESDVQRIEETLKDPEKHGIPFWLLNRQKDLETGRALHFIGPDLTLRTIADINFMRDIRSWKGTRHSLGLKVRGQRTKTTGRSGRVVGVAKKKLLQTAGAGAGATAPAASTEKK